MVEMMKLSLSLLSLFLLPTPSASSPTPPTAAPWPPQFHSILMLNTSKGLLQINDLWYDWPNGRNVNIIYKQLGEVLVEYWKHKTRLAISSCFSTLPASRWSFYCSIVLYDVEWDNGTSYYYTVGDEGQCQTMQFPVGIPRPDFLDGAAYLGQRHKDGFLCNVWTKVDFIWYYEDVVTKRPVAWDFYSGMTTQVMTFEVGKVLDASKWQAPSYCFEFEEAKLKLNKNMNITIPSKFTHHFDAAHAS